MKIHRLGEVRTVLGEGPYWDVQDQVLFFVDIRDCRLWRYDPSNELFSSWKTPVEPSGITRIANGGFLTALADGYYMFDPDSGAFDLVTKVDLGDNVQINDVKVDRQGRFIAGAKDQVGADPISSLYSFDGHHVTIIDDGYSISNGPCWSPDGLTFYIADSFPKNEIYAYDYDPESGTASNKRLFAECSGIGGHADGGTVDADGRMWRALSGDGKIVCFNPDGSIFRTIDTDIKWVSSLQFGGPDLDVLYATSFDPEAVAGFPPDDNSGYLYAVEGLGVRGLPEPLARMPHIHA